MRRYCISRSVLIPLNGHVWQTNIPYATMSASVALKTLSLNYMPIGACEEEVDLDSLPDQFVIKSVQGSGDVIIVRDKSQMDREKVMRQIHTMLHKRYGALEGGKHYLRIKPAVIVEELLPLGGG